jgi:hypothetical protein
VLAVACGGGGTNPTASTNFTGLAITDPQKTEVIRQIEETNKISLNYGVVDPKPASYYVVEIRPARPDICETPESMAEYTTDLFYDQTDYDKDPVVGKVLLCFSGRFVAPNKIIITKESIKNQLARFESEHLVLYHGNRSLYEATKYHDSSNIHPILK